jgi:Holliday junction resolvase RusA-like endonuclease
VASFAATLAVEPVPKGRPRFGQGHVYTPERTAQFETTVRWLLRQKKAPRLSGRIGVDITFWVKRQDSDGDNYTKAFLDASQGILFANDRQVKDCHYRLEPAAGGIMPCIEFTAWELDLPFPTRRDVERDQGADRHPRSEPGDSRQFQPVQPPGHADAQRHHDEYRPGSQQRPQHGQGPLQPSIRHGSGWDSTCLP